MSNKVLAFGPNGPMKTPGWFSWRHQTREVHDASRERYIATHATARARIARRAARANS